MSAVLRSISEEEAFGTGQVAQLRIPPNSIEAESSVLAGLLLDAGAWDRVGDLLTDDDFYRYEHRLIFAAIGQLLNACRPADVITVYEALQKTGKADEAGGLVYLNALAQYVPSAANIRRYAEIVRENAVLRRLISTTDEIATAAFNTQGRALSAIVDEAQAAMMRVNESASTGDDDWQDIDQGMVHLLDNIQSLADGSVKPEFTPTGLRDLDERLDGGMRPGELIVIGARPSMGKSALATSIAAHVALHEGLPVGMFSMEMPAMQLHRRLMSLVGQIHLSRIKRPERLRDHDWPSITEAVEKMRQVQFDINDQSTHTIVQLRSKARRLARKRGRLGALVVDYLGLMTGTDPRAPRTYQLGEITAGLKGLAKELHCPILLLQQVDRGVEKRDDPMPKLADLRDSGSIEQDADVVLFIHRPIKADPKLSDEWKPYAKLSVAKLRDGEPGFIDLNYIGENTNFTDWPDGQPVPSSRTRSNTGSSL